MCPSVASQPSRRGAMRPVPSVLYWKAIGSCRDGKQFIKFGNGLSMINPIRNDAER